MHKGSGMKALAIVSVGGLLTLGAGCAGDDGADESTQMDEVVAAHCDRNNQLPNNLPIRDESGEFATISANGSIDLNNEFFQDLGTNGRRCVSCHVPTVGWTITPAQLKATF
ncbi:MAG TPA: hypothetical protein VH165_36680, partial [Kofleriaceae bacterium]|nr:hypothetical protein [Kofleriaceae bacterium]